MYAIMYAACFMFTSVQNPCLMLCLTGEQTRQSPEPLSGSAQNNFGQNVINSIVVFKLLSLAELRGPSIINKHIILLVILAGSMGEDGGRPFKTRLLRLPMSITTPQ